MEELDPFAPDGVLAAPFEELCKRLQLMRRGELIVTVADDPLTRREVVARLADTLFDQIAFSEFTFTPDDRLSLARHVRGLLPPAGPAVVLASGLEDLAPPDRQEAIRRLNVERESFHQTRYSVILWTDRATVPDLAHQAGDFWAYKSVLIEFSVLLEEMMVEPSPLARLSLAEADRLRRLRAMYEEQLTRSHDNLPIAADLRLKLSEVYDKLGQEAERAQQLKDEALGLLAKLEDHQRLETLYRQTLADRHRALEFIGIPELRERAPITLDDIFIHLRAEIQTSRGTSLALAEKLAKAIATHKGDVLERDDPAWAELETEFQRALERGALTIAGAGPTENEQWRSELSRAIQEREATIILRLLEQMGGVRTVLARAAVNEVLGEHKRLVVLGDPGAGKTTLLRYLTVIVAEGRVTELGLSNDGLPLLPVFIQLRDFAAARTEQGEDYNLLDYLYAHAHQHLLLTLPAGFFESALEAGRALVCLDGLDEVARPDERTALVRTVAALAARFPHSRYLVTSRIVGYADAPLDRRQFTHCTILPFDDEDIARFIRQWYQVRERDPVERQRKAEDLIATIAGEPRIRALADNPLMLTIIALVHRIEAQLPHERVKLYDKCATALIETWDEAKGLTPADKQRPFYQYRRRLLERLAYWLHTNTDEPGRVQTIKQGDLELLLTRFLLENRRLQLDEEAARDEAQAFIRLARRRVGLLAERGEGRFGFPHLTFQEYLAACDIEARTIYDLDQVWAEIEPHLLEDHWREVILLLLGSLNKYDEPPTLMVERILAVNTKDAAQLGPLFLAARALADRVSVADKVRRQIVSDLLQVAQKSLSTWLFGPSELSENQMNAFTALSMLKEDEDAAIGLLNLAHDGAVYAGVCIAAAEALGKLGRIDEAANVLLTLARDRRVRARGRVAAIEALGKLGRTDEAADILLTLARDSEVDASVRVAAIEALGELGRTDEIVTILLKLARHSEVFNRVRTQAVKALDKLDRVNELLNIIRDSGTDASVRLAAAMALDGRGLTDEASNVLLTLARDDEIDFNIRVAAVEALDQLGHVEELLALAQDSKVGAGVCAQATMALGQMGLPPSPDWRMVAWLRLQEAITLGEAGHKEKAGSALLVLVHDRNATAGVNNQAVRKLVELGRVNELLTLARDREVENWLRALAIEGLAKLGRVDKLLTLVRDREAGSWLRALAIEGLGELGEHIDKTTLSSLKALVNDPAEDENVRQTTRRLLIQLSLLPLRQTARRVLERLNRAQ